MRLERELVALLGLLADRQQPHLGARQAEDLLGEDRAHVAELEQVLGARVRVRAAVEEHRRTVPRRDRDRDRRPEASIAPVFPAETTASADPSPTARQAATSELSGFARTASAGFSSIPIV